MIFIADSGSTKTDWIGISKGEVRKTIKTSGINAYYQQPGDMVRMLHHELLPNLEELPVELHFYGAGCTPGKKTDLIYQILKDVFPKAHVDVQSDMLGAARALCNHEPGIAGILGTGSNSCFYDGQNIAFQVPGLGYMLGDEGSGAVLGKKLIARYLRGQLNKEIMAAFHNEYSLSREEIVENIYEKPFPNRFLGSYTRFVKQHLDDKQMYDMVYQHFTEFYQMMIRYYEIDRYGLFLTGSIAHYFKDLIEEVAAHNEISIKKITESPIQDLIQFHLAKN